MLTNDTIKNIIIAQKLLDKKALEKIEAEANSQNKSLLNLVIEKKIISEENIYEIASQFLKIPFINLKGKIIRKDILFLVPEPIANTHKLIAFDLENEKLKIATLDPNDLQTLEFIKKKTGFKLDLFLTSPNSINDVLKQYHKGLKAEFQDITTPTESEATNNKDLKELATDLPVIRIVDTLLEYAIFESASDIHIEPMEKELLVRYRIDGILREVMTLPKSAQAGITARIKILANLKLDEHRQPQDGRFKISTDQYKVAFRVSIIPVFDGEKIVLRLLNESSQILTLEQLGFQKRSFQMVKGNIEKPHGMILVTGPTGSGKTTTLYTILNILNTPKVNIATVEDPVEYRMPRVNQSQINPKVGFTFASGLRSLLRQDPDIIMVGEIRDLETAEIAIHAAMTGHLVLSTLHTNDAVSTLPRLQDMGIASFLIATTTNLIVAQRLLRKICSSCIYSYNLNKENIKELEDRYNIDSLLETLVRENVIESKNIPLSELLFYRGKGCKICNNTGYKGRVGIYETLDITQPIQKLIMQKASARELLDAAKDQKMLTLFEDGIIKAKNGITTIEEIIRVTKA
ncbi:MAG: ATPase, T2SS/T4P/T4SS family [Candidatus Margulisiibacteriota bacterium]|jgi:type IV pilus assembly protein PilB